MQEYNLHRLDVQEQAFVHVSLILLNSPYI
jgi:hypothetical protein